MNRKLLFTFCFSLATAGLFAQMPESLKNPQAPAYMKASNANPACLVILANPLMGVTHSPVQQIPGGTYKRYSMSELYNSSPALMKSLQGFLTEDFKAMGINIPLFFNSGQEREKVKTETEADNTIRKQLFEKGTKYLVHITFGSYPNEKSLEKGKAKREDFVGGIMQIIEYHGGSVLNPEIEDVKYYINGSNYNDLIKKLQKDLAKNKPDYYEATTDAQVAHLEYYDIAEKEVFPTDLAQQEVLVVKYQGMMEGYTNKQMAKSLEKYPYKFKMIEAAEKGNYKTQGYKYVIEPKYAPHIQETANNNFAGSRTTTMIKPEYYYVMRDLSNNDLYYGTTLENLINNDNIMPSKALEYFVGNVPKQKAPSKRK